MGKHSREPRRPLILTADEQFLDQMLSLAAASGSDVHVAHDTSSARKQWTHASVVIVDDRVVPADDPWTMERRPNLVLVGHEHDNADVWQRALRVGAEHVVFLPDATEWLAEQLGTTIRPRTAEIIGVLGGCGGAGATTFSAALAMHGATKQRRVVLVDADPYGAGIDLLLGAEHVPGVRWDGMVDATGTIGHDMLVDALPREHGVSFLSFTSQWTPPPPALTTSSVLAALCDGGDLVVADLGDGREQSVAEPIMEIATPLVMVVPARVRAVAAAGVRLAALPHLQNRLQVVVRNPSPGGLEPEEIAYTLELPLLGTISHDSRRAEWEEHGIAPESRAAWSAACAELLGGRDATRPAA